MGRYTLNSEVLGLKPFVIGVPEDKKLKEKVNLTTIDALTLGSCPMAVLKELDFDNAKLVSQGRFYISYTHDNEKKELNVLFNDAHGLKSIALDGKTQISLNNKVFNDFIDKVFLPLTNDLNFMNFLRDNNFLSPKLNEWIGNLYSSSRKYGKDFCIQKIKEYASSYKKFRALVMAVELYRNPNFLKIKQEYDEERDPDLDGFLSPEEKKAYAYYMENLPDETHPHEDRYSKKN